MALVFIPKKLSYIGSCVDSFDEDGNSINNSFPYATVSEFACGEEDAKEITAEQFQDKAVFPKWVDTSHEIYYLLDEWNGIFILYDSNKDIHYFFGP
jgi:hypothetical protein